MLALDTGPEMVTRKVKEVVDSLISDDVRRKLGKEMVKPATLLVERGAIARFCQATGDPNPLWQDEEYASGTRFGGVIAPPGFISQLMLWDGEIQQALASIETPAPRMLAGGSQMEYFRPVKPGDVITATIRLVDAYERPGKTGKVLFLVTEANYINQDGLPAAREISTLIRY